MTDCTRPLMGGAGIHPAPPDWFPRVSCLRRAGGRIVLDPERTSSRSHLCCDVDRGFCGAVVADLEGWRSALDERLPGAIRVRLAVLVVGRDVARLDEH